MHTYNSNTVGSNAYFYGKLRELETLMDQEDPCTIWYTLSAADNHWIYLHILLYKKCELPDISNPIEDVQWKRNMTCRFLHIFVKFSVSELRTYLLLFSQMQASCVSGGGKDVSTKREVWCIFTDVLFEL